MVCRKYISSPCGYPIARKLLCTHSLVSIFEMRRNINIDALNYHENICHWLYVMAGNNALKFYHMCKVHVSNNVSMAYACTMSTYSALNKVNPITCVNRSIQFLNELIPITSCAITNAKGLTTTTLSLHPNKHRKQWANVYCISVCRMPFVHHSHNLQIMQMHCFRRSPICEGVHCSALHVHRRYNNWNPYAFVRTSVSVLWFYIVWPQNVNFVDCISCMSG